MKVEMSHDEIVQACAYYLVKKAGIARKYVPSKIDFYMNVDGDPKRVAQLDESMMAMIELADRGDDATSIAGGPFAEIFGDVDFKVKRDA